MFQILISLRTVLFWTFARCVHQTYSGFKSLAATFKNPCLATDTRIFSWVKYAEVGEPSRCENCLVVMRKWLYFQWEWVFLFDGWWHRALEIQLPLEKREVGCDNSFIELFPYLTQMIMFVSKFEICCEIFTMELFQNLIKSVSVSIDCSWASPASFVFVGKGSLIVCFFSLLQKFTRWANAFLQHSQDQFLITDLVRDLGDGITLLSLVEMLGRSSIF